MKQADAIPIEWIECWHCAVNDYTEALLFAECKRRMLEDWRNWTDDEQNVVKVEPNQTYWVHEEENDSWQTITEQDKVNVGKDEI